MKSATGLLFSIFFLFITSTQLYAGVGDADVNTSIITSSSKLSDKDNGSGVTITVQAKNGSSVNETAGGETVTLSASSGSITAVTDNNNGTYTATLTDTTAETVTVSGKISGVNIVDNASVIFFQLDGSANDWKDVLKGANFDPGGDQQAVSNSSIDLVGTANDGTMYAIYDAGILPDDVSDDKVCYRFRVGGSKSNSFSGYVWIGVNVDPLTDGDNDVYIRVYGNGKSGAQFSGEVKVYDAGTGTNTSPSTSSVANGVAIASLTDGTNFEFTQIGGTPDPDPDVTNNNINSDSELDWMISYCVDWTDLRDTINAKPIKDDNDGSPPNISIDKDSLLSFTLSTSINGNNVNSDVGGYEGGVDDDTVTFVDQGATSPPLSFSNVYPVLTVASVTVNEGISTSTTVVDASATDADGDTVTFSLSGTDSGDFNITTSTGVVTFAVIPDYGSPADDDTNNIYSITVNASDGEGGTDTEAITITVNEVVAATVDTGHASTKIESTDAVGDADTADSGAVRVTLVDNGGTAISGIAVTFAVASGSCSAQN